MKKIIYILLFMPVLLFSQSNKKTAIGSTFTGGGGGGSTDYVSNVSLGGTTLTFTAVGSAFSGGIDLSSIDTDTDAQTLSILGDQLTISNGNTVTVPSGGGSTDYVNGVSVVGTNMTFTGVGSAFAGNVDLTSIIDYVSNVSLGGTTLTFTAVGSAFSGGIDLSSIDTDQQTLSISNDTIFISNGNNIKLPGGFTDTNGMFDVANEGGTWAVLNATLGGSTTIEGNSNAFSLENTSRFAFEAIGGGNTNTIQSETNILKVESEAAGNAYKLWMDAVNDTASFYNANNNLGFLMSVNGLQVQTGSTTGSAGDWVLKENDNGYAYFGAPDSVYHNAGSYSAVDGDLDFTGSAPSFTVTGLPTSGTFTPTLAVISAGSHSAYGADLSHWQRVGDIVNFTTEFNINMDTTTASNTVIFTFSIPVASDFALGSDAKFAISCASLGGGITPSDLHAYQLAAFTSADPTNDVVFLTVYKIHNGVKIDDGAWRMTLSGHYIIK